VIDPSARVAKGVSIAASVVIGPNATLPKGVCIHPNARFMKTVTIGKDSVIHSGVAVRERTVIGQRVIIHNNAVIGCDGFGYAKDEKKHWLKIPQAGRVVLEDDVEVGAGTTIDRASVGGSRIGVDQSWIIWFRLVTPAPSVKIRYSAPWLVLREVLTLAVESSRRSGGSRRSSDHW
jgi:UDP-3-O-[3-hydroxymyristoyl] glucosamine N-acyltransferase LpxD